MSDELTQRRFFHRRHFRLTPEGVEISIRGPLSGQTAKFAYASLSSDRFTKTVSDRSSSSITSSGRLS